ncbi:MAG: glyoxalase [Actinomycetota bacterium]|nr:glyoxalase [Acidimicrobiia bacterium]MDQ3293390.1 glyoxalase [Actinomycetota bacterium]
MLHHLTLWVPDLAGVAPSWRWLLGALGYHADPAFDSVLLFRGDDGFALVLEESSDMVPGALYSRMRPGLNHVAFTVPPPIELATLVAVAGTHGWSVLPIDGHPIAGGAEVAYLEDPNGFEVELVAPA